MADRLNDDERAAIAAFRGEVTRFAPGETGIPEGRSWLDADISGCAWRKMQRERRFKSAALQARIVALARDGRSVAQIARAVGLRRDRVKERLQRAGLALREAS